MGNCFNELSFIGLAFNDFLYFEYNGFEPFFKIP